MKIKLLRFQILILILLSNIIFGFSRPSNLIFNQNLNDVETIISIPQNSNQTGLVVIKGNLIKKITSNDVLLNIQYLDDNNNWIVQWSKNFNSQTVLNENQEVFFELPPSNVQSRKIKILFTSKGGKLLNDEIIWNKSIYHYNYGDYSVNNSCAIDESKYTMLITPKDDNIIYNSDGAIIGIKDKINSNHIYNKKQTVLSINKPANLIDENGTKSIKIVNNGNINDILAQTPELNYADTLGRPSPYLYSYVDPIYIFAGKFSVNGFKLKFSQWPKDFNGPGYHDFSNPDQLISRYFNLYNTIDQKLSDIIIDQEPVVFVSSRLTGFRVYKQDGSIINLTGHSNYTPSAYFGYPPDQGGGFRGPGSESFIISKTNDITLYGMGAIANGSILNNNKDKPIGEIDSEILTFIKYSGIFGKDNSCYAINSNAVPNYTDDIDKNILAAPNSYIYDINLAKTNNYGGIYIPVNKAYDVWRDSKGFINKKIPDSQQTASVVWQDKEGLISSVSIVGTGNNAKLKVEVNQTKGKGNAVVALHVGNNSNDSDPIYWSWHIWVTDDPVNGVTYVNNGDNRMVNTFMDRNLGALSDDFLGNDWNKSGGLMYQWGRKDPMPIFSYIDSSPIVVYTKNKIINDIYDFKNSYAKNRGFNNINDNIIYAINNPLNYILRTENSGAWFASMDNNKKIKGNDGYAVENYDLWGDNNKGITKKASFEKQVKSPYDPCPAGWRVPSYAHSDSTVPNFSPWGSSYNYTYNENTDYPVSESGNRYPNVKFYPLLGVDFKKGEDNHYLGRYSSTGAYKMINSGLSFQDNVSEIALWSSTLNQNAQGLFLKIVNDPLGSNNNGAYSISTTQATPTSEGLAVRCSKDEITKLNFNTEYFNSSKINYTEGLENPNSYILFQNREISIPVNKAYSVYNQILTNQEWIPNGQQSSNVYWTTNQNLIKSINVTGVGENAFLNLKLNDNQYGNAVVSLHIGNSGDSSDPIYWSWHIWVPKENIEASTTEYITDGSNKSSKFKVFNTETGFPPIKTEFLGLPLGSLKKSFTPENYVTTEGFGFHYQWGRKDPIPSFFDGANGTIYPIYLGRNKSGVIQYDLIADNSQFEAKGFIKNNKQSELSEKDVLKFTIQNPLAFLYNTQTVNSDWLSNKMYYSTDRWGHASSKSIYDPCPQGWRVPDFGHIISQGSPWFNNQLKTKIANDGFYQWTASNNLSYYNVAYNKRATDSRIRAYFYKNSIYNMNFYLPGQGFRGTNTKNAKGIFDNNISSSLWSATISNSQKSAEKGGALYLSSNFSSNYHTVSEVYKLNNAHSIVCSKDTPRFTEAYFQDLTKQNVGSRVLSYTDVDNNQLERIDFYPNPVDNILKTNSNKSIKAKIYNIDGMLMLEGQFLNRELDVSLLKAGVYILIVNDKEKGFRFIKK